MQEIVFFSGQIYTASTNITQPPVVTVATNLKSVTGIRRGRGHAAGFLIQPT